MPDAKKKLNDYILDAQPRVVYVGFRCPSDLADKLDALVEEAPSSTRASVLRGLVAKEFDDTFVFVD